MNKILFATVAIIVGLLAGPISAYACDCGWGPGPGTRNSHAAVPDDARLSADQQAAIDGIRSNYRKPFDSLRARIADADSALDTELAKPEPDLAKIKNLRKQRADLIAETDSLRDKMDAEVKKVLSERQRSYYGNYAFCPCGWNRSGNNCGGWGW